MLIDTIAYVLPEPAGSVSLRWCFLVQLQSYQWNPHKMQPENVQKVTKAFNLAIKSHLQTLKLDFCSWCAENTVCSTWKMEERNKKILVKHLCHNQLQIQNPYEKLLLLCFHYLDFCWKREVGKEIWKRGLEKRVGKESWKSGVGKEVKWKVETPEIRMEIFRKAFFSCLELYFLKSLFFASYSERNISLNLRNVTRQMLSRHTFGNISFCIVSCLGISNT